MEAPELVAAREVVRTRPEADLATLPMGFSPCHSVVLAERTESAAFHARASGPVTIITSTCASLTTCLVRLFQVAVQVTHSLCTCFAAAWCLQSAQNEQLSMSTQVA